VTGSTRPLTGEQPSCAGNPGWKPAPACLPHPPLRPAARRLRGGRVPPRAAIHPGYGFSAQPTELGWYAGACSRYSR